MVAQVWRQNLDYTKNLQAKYFTGENIPIYDTYLFILSIDQHMHGAMLPDLMYTYYLVLTPDPCIMQEVEQYEEQADGYSTHTSGQEQHDMELEGPADDTNSELLQDLRSSDSGKISLISMHALYVYY